MHRVELKDKRRFAYKHWTIHLVPNAPCGVESVMISALRIKSLSVFLMHRVELKGPAKVRWGEVLKISFLMHRVELKDINLQQIPRRLRQVPSS